MRRLLDNNVPRGLGAALTGHAVTEARERGWATFKNGDLLTAAEEASFEVNSPRDFDSRTLDNFTSDVARNRRRRRCSRARQLCRSGDPQRVNRHMQKPSARFSVEISQKCLLLRAGPSRRHTSRPSVTRQNLSIRLSEATRPFVVTPTPLTTTRQRCSAKGRRVNAICYHRSAWRGALPTDSFE